MTACPIFQTFSAAKAISAELDQLVDDIVARLRSSGLFKNVADKEWDDCLPDEKLTWLETGGAVTILVSMRHGAGAPLNRHLSLRFDLNREVPEGHSSWQHASEALIVVGWSPLRDVPWTNEIMAVTAEGRLRDNEAWEACRNNSHAGGKLLRYTEAGPTWAQRSWVFAVPLRSLTRTRASATTAA
jgi:hypothetical protein